MLLLLQNKMAVYTLLHVLLFGYLTIGLATDINNLAHDADLEAKLQLQNAPPVFVSDLSRGSRQKYMGVPQKKIRTSCRAFIEKFADVAAEFTRCSIINSRPIRFCECCVNEYVTAKSVYNVIMKGMAVSDMNEQCGATILNSDKIQLIVQTANFLDKVWSDSYCSNCFIDQGVVNGTQVYSVSEDTAKFQEMANQSWQCFANHSSETINPFHEKNVTENSSDVCTECLKFYQDTNKFYVSLEEKYTHHVCMDIVDAMNFTRILWSRNFDCNRPQGDIVGVLILSALFCASPILFYISTKIYGTRMEHRILEEKRLKKNQASTSQADT